MRRQSNKSSTKSHCDASSGECSELQDGRVTAAMVLAAIIFVSKRMRSQRVPQRPESNNKYKLSDGHKSWDCLHLSESKNCTNTCNCKSSHECEHTWSGYCSHGNRCSWGVPHTYSSDCKHCNPTRGDSYCPRSTKDTACSCHDHVRNNMCPACEGLTCSCANNKPYVRLDLGWVRVLCDPQCPSCQPLKTA